MTPFGDEAALGGRTMGDEPGIGPRYQEATKYRREHMGHLTTWAREVPAYKEYTNPLETLPLPPPQTEGGLPLWQTIAARRTQRRFTAAPLSLADLSQLLWATQGLTGKLGHHDVRAAASAGALFPDETYLCLNRVEGCAPGIWHYRVREHAVERLAEGLFGEALARACMGQTFCDNAPVVFAWGAVIDRCAWKYADRAYRYIYLDAGHIGAQLQLATTALGLGSVNIGAFFDDEVNALYGLDGRSETIIYLTAVGHLA
jgi:SagB-type dehydrogenase family enzyme